MPALEIGRELGGGDMAEHRSHGDIASTPGLAEIIIKDIVLNVLLRGVVLGEHQRTLSTEWPTRAWRQILRTV